MLFLTILLYLAVHNSEMVYPYNFLKKDEGVCLQNLINGTAIYGSCIFTLHGFNGNLENPLCESFNGEILLYFLTTNHDQIIVKLGPYRDDFSADFSFWHDCQLPCTSCNVSYKPGTHITVTGITSQLRVVRQLTRLTIDNYNYQDCFSNDQTFEVFIENSRAVFVVQMYPSRKCSMIPSNAITEQHITLMYLDTSDNKLKKLVQESIKSTSSIFSSTVTIFTCQDECFSNYYSLLSSPFVFLYTTLSISLATKNATLTNRLFGLTTVHYNDCFSYIRVVVSGYTISAYISRTVSTVCPFNETHEKVPIHSVSPEILIFGFRQQLEPTRFASPHALNLVDGKGVLVYDCSTCISMIRKGKTTPRNTDVLFQTSLMSDLALTLHLGSGSIDILRYPVKLVEMADWDTTYVTVMSFMLTFNASNTMLRDSSATSTNCTHVQLIFVPNRSVFQDIFLERVEKENSTVIMALSTRTGSLFASMKCVTPDTSTMTNSSCTGIIDKLKSQNSMIYYQLMANDRTCGNIYPVDKVILDSIFGLSIALYGIVLGTFFIIITILFAFLIVIERYNTVNKYRES